MEGQTEQMPTRRSDALRIGITGLSMIVEVAYLKINQHVSMDFTDGVVTGLMICGISQGYAAMTRMSNGEAPWNNVQHSNTPES